MVRDEDIVWFVRV